jgi:hypothetical protein
MRFRVETHQCHVYREASSPIIGNPENPMERIGVPVPGERIRPNYVTCAIAAATSGRLPAP